MVVIRLFDSEKMDVLLTTIPCQRLRFRRCIMSEVVISKRKSDRRGRDIILVEIYIREDT